MTVHEATADVFAPCAGAKGQIAPTPRSVIRTDGKARLYRFHPSPDDPPAAPADASPPVLLVPSIINRWYVLDLRRGASLIEALVRGGIDTYCLDWGTPEDEDRYVTWDDLIGRLRRTVRMLRRNTGVDRIGLLGYCMGATLAGVYAALDAPSIGAFVNLAGPFDFAKAGVLAHQADARWFDAGAIADAGNVPAELLQAGFLALRPTQNIAKLVGMVDRVTDKASWNAFATLETWANDNIPFPAEAYRTYIQELYQANALIEGSHRVRGEPVDLSKIDCPVLTITAERDAICPPAAATALNEHVSSEETKILTVPGGHVGAVIGSRARAQLYPAIVDWFRTRVPARSAAAPLQPVPGS